MRPTSDLSVLREIGAERVSGDIADPRSVEASVRGVDAVFHLAAVTAGRGKAAFQRVNVDATRVLAAAVAGATRPPDTVIYLSSYAACGPAEGGVPVRMDDPPRPITAYGRSKLAGEAAFRELLPPGTHLSVLRAPAVYGPGYREMVPVFRLAKWGLAPLPGGGRARLHLIFAPDLARALVRAVENPVNTVAVADPRVFDWSHVVEAISRAMGRGVIRFSLPAPWVRGAALVADRAAAWTGASAFFNPEKAEEMLADGWLCDRSGSEKILPDREVTPMEDGMRQTVAWYRSRGWL